MENAWDDAQNYWARYQTAESVGLENHYNVGELSSYPNSGYFLIFDPIETSKEDYREHLDAAGGALFGNGARSVMIEFAIYSKTLNYWVYVKLTFEFSISDQVIFTKSFEQFRTDIYETEQEKIYKWLDIFRLIFCTVISLIYAIEVIMEAKNDGSCTLSGFVKFLACLFCLSLFIIEFVLIMQ